MARQVIDNTSETAGDVVKVAFDKVNEMTSELYGTTSSQAIALASVLERLSVLEAAAVRNPTISFTNPTVTVPEGNSGTSTVSNTINVNRDGLTGALTINLTYAGTAASGTDYVAGPTSLTIGSSVSSGSFDLLVNGETVSEVNETIVINAALAGYSATASKTITITNDDAPLVQSVGLMTDIDDVVAEMLLFDMLDERSLPLSYVSVASRNDDAAHAQRVLLNASGRNAVPIGQMLTPTSANSVSLYDTSVANLLLPKVTRTGYPDSAVVMRTALAAMPDKSHVIITIGNLTDYAALLASPGDSISSLTGAQLVAAKVIAVYSMGGRFPTDTTTEANVNGDITSANYVDANTPVDIFWAPYAIGNDVLTRINTTGYSASTDPFVVAWNAYNVSTRPSWDSIPVLHALLGLNGWFTVSEPGTVSFTDGTSWTANPAGKSRYLTRTTTATVLRDYINTRTDAFMVRKGIPAPTTLAGLTVSPSTATIGTAYSGTISGKTASSTLALSGSGAAGLSISGTTISGTPTTAGAVDIVETLAGAVGSPRTSSSVVTVSATVAAPAAVATFTTATNGATLQATPLDSGQSWTKVTGGDWLVVRTTIDSAYPSNSGFYTVNGFTTGDNLDVEADILFRDTNFQSIYSRFYVGDSQNYLAVGWQQGAGWRLGRKVANTYTALSTTAATPVVGTKYTIKAQVRGGLITLLVNGTVIATDVAIGTAALTGRAVGLEATSPSTATSGPHMTRMLYQPVN